VAIGGATMRRSLVNRWVLGLLGLQVWTMLPWTFHDLALLAYGLAVIAFLALTTRSRPVRLGLTGLAIFGAVHFAYQLPATFPLQARVSEARFVDAPLATVLQHIARQGATDPHWRFVIGDEQAASAIVTVAIPDGCSLREALGIVARAARCEYTWNWNLGCGNAPRPLCAVFHFRTAGVLVKDPWACVVLVDHHGTIDCHVP
jgi:hypothetical protein